MKCINLLTVSRDFFKLPVRSLQRGFPNHEQKELYVLSEFAKKFCSIFGDSALSVQ